MNGTVVAIRADSDIVTARQRARELAANLGFSASQQVEVATAISEIARNILKYAGEGEVEVEGAEDRGRRGIVVVARDRGPGIRDVAVAMRDGYTTGGGLGLGLPGARRLMDEFEIASGVGEGTTVTMRKWAR